VPLPDTRVLPDEQRAGATAILATAIACAAAFKGLKSVTPPALPILQQEFHVSASTISWVLSGVLLTGTIVTPIVSRLGEVWDKRKTLLGVLAVVATGTLISALSMSIEMLIAGQLLQGFGLSTVPLAVGIIRSTQSEARTKSANGLLVGAIYGSVAAGTMIAGPIADYLSYRWLFWVPLLALIACIAAVWFFIPRSLDRSAGRAGIDVAGSALLAIGLASVFLAFTFAPGWGWLSPEFLLLLAAGLVVLLIFTRVELAVSDPLIDLRLMRSFTVVAASALMFLAGFCIDAALVNVPMQTQLSATTGYGLGRSATITAAILVSTTLIGLTAPLISMLDKAIGSRLASAIGPVSILGGVALMLALGERGSIAVVFTVTLLVTFGLSVSMTQSLNLVVNGVPADKVTEFSGLNFAIQAISGAIGAHVAGAVLTVESAAAGAPPPWAAFATSWAICGVVAIVVLAVVLAVRTPKVPSA
jgi:MFS family permease